MTRYNFEAVMRQDRSHCVCGKLPCGFVEVTFQTAVKLLSEGFVVYDGLDDKLAGYWTAECCVKAYKIENAVKKGVLSGF